MRFDEDDAVWCLVMFDLPVGTKQERAHATGFRNMLLDLGFDMVQFSVYVRYTPSSGGAKGHVDAICLNLPPGGDVRILHMTDRQWAKALRFSAEEPVEVEEPPQLLTIF